MSNHDDPIDKAVKAMLANKSMEETEAYLSRGRLLADRADEDLNSGWLEQMNLWADRSPAADMQMRDDCEAELGLRGLEPPHAAAQDAIAKLQASTRKAYDALIADPEQLERANDHFAAEIDKAFGKDSSSH